MAERLSPLDRPLIRAEFTMPDGSVPTREWTMRDIEAEGNPLSDGPPEWLESPSRSWLHPQDPITFKGTVQPGHEQDARDFLGMAHA